MRPKGRIPPRSKITQAIDELTKLHNNLLGVKETFKPEYRNMTSAVVHLVETFWYDCMSGGCSSYWLAGIRQIIENQRIDLSTPVWFEGKTLGSFLKEIEKAPRFDKLLTAEERRALPSF